MEWISVKDKLPASCMRVLASEAHGYQAVCHYYPNLKEFHELEQKRNITHWMLLPEKPKELVIDADGKTYKLNKWIELTKGFIHPLCYSIGLLLIKEDNGLCRFMIGTCVIDNKWLISGGNQLEFLDPAFEVMSWHPLPRAPQC